MNFRKAFLTFLSVVVSVTPCYSNAMKESSYCESSPLINKSKKIENCPICLEKMDPDKDLLTSSGCASGVPHIYHTRCWNEWIKKAPRNEHRKVPCPLCKKPCTAPIYCSYCYELINDDEAVGKFSCNHSVHWTCVDAVSKFVAKYQKEQYVYCVECDRFPKNGRYHLGNAVKHLSPERIKEIAIQAYPRLAEKLKPKNTCNKKLLVLLGLGAVASVIGVYAMS